MELVSSKDDEINLWLDRLADYNLAPANRELKVEDLLKVIVEIWDDQVASEELDIISRILLATENLIEGRIQQKEWVDQMNECFNGVWENA